MNTGRPGLGSSGLQTAALGFGGSNYLSATESYNGTSWTTVNSLNTGRGMGASAGTQTAALFGGGYVGPAASAATELWNGQVGHLLQI